MMDRRPQHGFTLVELMIVLVVATIALLATLPSFVGTFTRIRVEGTGNELAADLQYARSEALRRRASVSLVSSAGGYLITTPNPAAAGTIQLKGVEFASGLRVAEGAVTVTYDAMRAMVANEAVMTLSDSAESARLRITVNAMGRVEMCSPGHTISNYPTC
jgi:type IV fimbrial biogenesis protein FimT